MQELRLVAVSEDGSYVILTQPGRGTRFSLPNDERLRAVARGQFSRLAQYEIEVESPLRPKEIQARIRAGETADQIADAAGIPVDRVRWFEGPVLAERAYIAQQAQNASVRRPGDSGPGPRLGEIVAERLRTVGDDPEDAEWDSIKRADGSWLVQLAPSGSGRHDLACWVFDIKRRHAIPDDDEAARLSLTEDALAEAGLDIEPEVPARRSGTVTPFVPRSAPPPDVARDLDAGPGRRPASGPRAPAGPQQEASPRRAASLAGSHRASADLPRQQQSGRTQQPARTQEPRRTQEPGRPRERDWPGEPETSPASPAAASPDAAASPAAAQGSDTHAAQGTDTHAAADTPAAAQAADRRYAARRSSGSAARSQAADEATAAEGGEHSEAAAAQGQGRQAASSGRGGRKGRIRRSSVPTWDEIMFGDSRRED